MKVKEALTWAIRQLDLDFIAKPKIDALLLLSHTLGKKKEWISAHPGESLSQEALKSFKDAVEKRRNGKPLHYILGCKEFMGLKFEVNESVLIPRFETEDLVGYLIERYARRAYTFADIGTGSGAIGVSLAYHLPLSHIYATDISEEALVVARKNAKNIGVDERIKFLKGDLLEPLKDVIDRIDVVIANLPYVKVEDYEELPLDVRREPEQALLSSERGIGVYKTLLLQMKTYGISTAYIECTPAEIGELTAFIFSLGFGHRVIKDSGGAERFMVIGVEI
ncbi:MAG: peptide chain release factor N(5)-glutamine methyltransferase [Thermotoga sp.]|nr:MAG: peptide chain release factor N(5)-glutamine methyltransferase [Thermotoga sp.]